MSIPARPVLKEYLDAQEWDGLVMVTTNTGRTFKADHFRHEFRKALNATGLQHLLFHGLRHTMGRRLAEVGADVQTILCHKTEKMARHYSSEANKDRQTVVTFKRLDEE